MNREIIYYSLWCITPYGKHLHIFNVQMRNNQISIVTVYCGKVTF